MTLKGISRVVLVTAIVIGTPALAQEAPGGTAGDAVANGDIVVTAQRVTSLASKTPIALSAIDGDALRNSGITNPTRLDDQVPSLSIVRNNGLQITIRGVSSSDNTEKGDPSAAFLLDGVYLARPQAQEVSFYDIARVEVLRGPQGTLYGRNTTAGLINVITNRPSDHFEAAGNIGYGNYNSLQADAMINLPVSDLLSLRFAGAYDGRDSYLIQNVGTPHKIDPFKRNWSGRGQALFKFSPDLTLLIRADYNSMRGNGFGQVLGKNYYAPLAAGQPGYTNRLYVGEGMSSEQLRQINFATVGDMAGRGSTWGVDGELNWAFSGLAVTYLGSYREFRQYTDTTGFQGISYRSLATGLYKQVSQELRVATDGSGPIKAQAGGYYFREDSHNALELFNLLPAYPYYAFLQGPTKSETIGVFGQATWNLTDSLHLTGGVRWSHDKKSRIGGSYMQKTLNFNPATDVFSPNNAETSSEKVTWRVGVDYDLDNRTLLYASVATGYKGGGFNGGCLATAPNCPNPRTRTYLFYAPETLTAYEVGLKTRFADNKVRLNASAFYYDYDNLQVSSIINDNGAPRQFTTNAARARVKGVELETTITPSPRNRVDASFTWLDAEYASYFPLGVGNAPDFKGRPLDRAPRVVATAGYSYTLPLANGGSLMASVRSRLSSEYFMTAQAVGAQYRQPGYTRTDLTLRYQAPGDKYYVQGFWRNLENKVVATNISLSSGTLLVTPSDPMTYGVQAGFRF
ncbi:MULTISPECIES: TonB-dependent receptor [unclassified Sphingomonas]|uniref:TonB-dependent receptor n=1 Tax=unclassified Sphingomonas TaxID=196159 RepID=UPI00092B99C5|nr:MULTISPECIES: TonB-dependent receptor [unclassified Sphingomonas]MBN8847974.1 TonB-dependent receptor [Sphingomonas sp.]OJV34212.1 MAG: hypothetical protein BGO24_13740 [Sphingomonas sp. 67-36]